MPFDLKNIQAYCDYLKGIVPTEYKVLNLNDIMNASIDYDYPFSDFDSIPFVDCLTNELIVYILSCKKWVVLCIEDDTMSKWSDSIEELLKK